MRELVRRSLLVILGTMRVSCTVSAAECRGRRRELPSFSFIDLFDSEYLVKLVDSRFRFWRCAEGVKLGLLLLLARTGRCGNCTI